MKLLPAGPAHEREGMAAAGFLLAVALGLAAAPSPAGAGTVVVLRSRALGVYDSLAAGFRASYRGSVADLVLGETDDPALGSRIAALHPDVVVAVGLRAALFTRDQLARTPLVFCAVQQPERRGLQGVWVTGVSGDVPPETELAALKTAAPDVRRVVLFYGRGSGAPFARAARAAAASLELELIEVPLADLSELAGAVRGATEGADALWLPPDPVVAASPCSRSPTRWCGPGRWPPRAPISTWSGSSSPRSSAASRPASARATSRCPGRGGCAGGSTAARRERWVASSR